MATRSYTAAEYRKAGINAGPYALESNPYTNFRTNRRKPILGVVMHITAGMTDYSGADTSADATTRYGATTSREASWHVCIDSDGIIPSVRDAYTAWHAGVSSAYWSHPARPYVNDATLGIEQGTGVTNWAGMPDWWVERTLRNVAVWAAPRVKKYGIPLTVVRDRTTVGNAIMAGRPFGFVSHAVMAPHNRTDPGVYQGRDTYPWARLFTMIREELAGTTTAPTPVPEEDDMPYSPEQIKQMMRDVLAEENVQRNLFQKHPIFPNTTGSPDDLRPDVPLSTLLEAAAKDALRPEPAPDQP